MIKQISMTPIDYHNPNKFWTQAERDFYKGMSDEERIAATILRLVYTCIGILVAVLLCALLSGCTTTKYVTVPEYHTDTLRLTQYERDSIYVLDSVAHRMARPHRPRHHLPKQARQHPLPCRGHQGSARQTDVVATDAPAPGQHRAVAACIAFNYLRRQEAYRRTQTGLNH